MTKKEKLLAATSLLAVAGAIKSADNLNKISALESVTGLRKWSAYITLNYDGPDSEVDCFSYSSHDPFRDWTFCKQFPGTIFSVSAYDTFDSEYGGMSHSLSYIQGNYTGTGMDFYVYGKELEYGTFSFNGIYNAYSTISLEVWYYDSSCVCTSCGSTCDSSCKDGCQGCNTTCSGGCGNGCQSACGGNCQGCTTGCQDGCKTNCTGTCNTGCTGTCHQNCSGCSGSCKDGCNSCVGCSTVCKHDCADGCKITCQSSCTGTCQAAARGIDLLLGNCYLSPTVIERREIA